MRAEQHGPAGRECANAADEVRSCGACSPRRWRLARCACASCRARHAGVDINQVGVPVDINQIPTAQSAADGQRLQPPRDRHRAAREHGADLHGAWHGRTKWLKVKRCWPTEQRYSEFLYRMLYRRAVLVHGHGAHDDGTRCYRSLLMGTEKRIFNHILVSYLRPALLHRILPFVFVSYLPIASRAASFDSLAAACNSTLLHEVNVVPLRSSLRYFSIRRSFS